MIDERKKTDKIISVFLLLVLVLYPLRHIWLGVEVTDSAYSAGNYRFPEYMNPMWFFSTYLGNVVGHFLSGLPGGDRLMGLNFYTALFVSVTAMLLYLFFTRVIRADRFPVFFGELLAVSLCWCPTTILYNYMTYLFFNLGIVLLYLGLVKERRFLLLAAGAALGINVLVRFPNLTEAALILSLWYYGFLQRKRVKDVVQETGICLLGYLAGAGAILASIAVKYGIQEYVAGLVRLMQMPSDAADYSPLSMVLTVLLDYKFSARWLIHMLILTAAGCLVSALVYKISAGTEPGRKMRWAGKILFLGGVAVLFCWWYRLGVFNVKYYTYESMFQWVAVFLILVIGAGLCVIFSGKYSRNEKLLSSLTLILIGITPLGSNNHLYPNINNMFLVLPFGLLFFCRFLKELREEGELFFGKAENRMSLFPVRAMLGMFLAVLSVQCLLFGAVFTFRDGMSGQKRDTKIEKNDILKGMTTNAPLAEAIEGLTEYVEGEGLSDRSVILYGQIPALSYILDMPPAISTSWPDLASYNYEVLEEDMEKLRGQPSGSKKPLIILGAGPAQWIGGAEMTAEEKAYHKLDEKWELIYGYMTEQGYEECYGNGMFFVYFCQQ